MRDDLTTRLVRTAEHLDAKGFKDAADSLLTAAERLSRSGEARSAATARAAETVRAIVERAGDDWRAENAKRRRRLAALARMTNGDR